MDETEEYLKRWIKLIVKETSALRIKRHIIHHAKQLCDPNVNNPISWLASMYNLLEIYESIHKVKATPPIKIYKLLCKYNTNPRIYTTPPGVKFLRI
jgi:hypothetical protein